jgi:hypothetical protein
VTDGVADGAGLQNGRQDTGPFRIAHFLYEQRIGGKPESPDAVRLQTEGGQMRCTVEGA